MNTVEQMKAEILRRAKEEADGIIERAKKEAKTIIEEAQREASEGSERAMRELTPKLKRMKEEITREALSEGRRKLLKIKDKLISEVFDRLENEVKNLASVGGEEYKDLLEGLIEEGIRCIGEQKIRVTANGRDSELIGRHIEGMEKNLTERLGNKVELNLGDDTLECIGGVILTSMDEKLIYYNTLESRIIRIREQFRFEVAKTLFGE